MSGGVDSALAAVLLQEAGYEVAGVTFKLFCYGESASRDKACCGLEGVRDAQATARRLGIPHSVLDLSELFRERVFGDFVSEYVRGRTPNPCVQCNTHIKFGPLLEWGRRFGFDWVATGHYVRRVRIATSVGDRWLLARARHVEKDQSYVLWGLDPALLGSVLFPLGDHTKHEVRDLARNFGLPVWDKAESQDLCFVDDEGYAAAVARSVGEDHLLLRAGEIRDIGGKLLGSHRGLVHYTVGQRRGLGLGGGDSLHVVELEASTNTLVVGTAADTMRRSLIAEDVNTFVPDAELAAEGTTVKIRYRHVPAPATVTRAGVRLNVRFESAQSAVSPGQSCVVYRDDLLLAGGRIAGGTVPAVGTSFGV